MRIFLIVAAQWFTCFIAIFSIMTGWGAIQEGQGAFVALFGFLFAAGVAGFIWFSAKVSEEIHSY